MVHVVARESRWLVLGPIGEPEYDHMGNAVSFFLFDLWVNLVLAQPPTLDHPKPTPRRIYCGTLWRQSTATTTGFRVLSIYC